MSFLPALKSKLIQLSRNDHVRRVFHTAWQVGFPLLISHLVMAKSSADVKSAFVLAGAAALAAVKALVLSRGL